MDDILSGILTLGIISILGFFVYYIFKTYLAPKKLNELADMIKLGHYAPAIRKLNLIIAENDRDSYAHLLLGEAYRLQKKPQKQSLSIKRF